MARVRALRRGVARRGRLPELELRAGFANDRRHSDDHDEVWSSGDLRALHDRGSDRDRAYEVDVLLRWDLGDLRYHPEAVDEILEFLSRNRQGDAVIETNEIEPVQLQLICQHIEARVISIAFSPAAKRR